MKKKLLVILLAIIIAFSQVACSGVENNYSTQSQITDTEKPNNKKVSTPCFWKVTGNGYDGELYLLGSIHVGDENTNLYPNEITEAFDQCDHLAVESDIVAIETDFSTQMQMTQAIMYLDGTTIKDHIDSEIYNDAKETLTEGGLYNATLDLLKPIYWMMLIENVAISKSDYSETYGVDRHFLQKAKEENKTILEIENPVETYELLVSLDDATQELLLKQASESTYVLKSAISTQMLYSLWKKGNVKSIEKLITADSTVGMTNQEIKAYEEYNDMLLNTRNEQMVETAAEYLETDKDVFYIVGLAHMFGDDGIVSGLSDMGYTVTQVRY